MIVIYGLRQKEDNSLKKEKVKAENKDISTEGNSREAAEGAEGGQAAEGVEGD